jgi:hypothetical protein
MHSLYFQNKIQKNSLGIQQYILYIFKIKFKKQSWNSTIHSLYFQNKIQKNSLEIYVFMMTNIY